MAAAASSGQCMQSLCWLLFKACALLRICVKADKSACWIKAGARQSTCSSTGGHLNEHRFLGAWYTTAVGAALWLQLTLSHMACCTVLAATASHQWLQCSCLCSSCCWQYSSNRHCSHICSYASGRLPAELCSCGVCGVSYRHSSHVSDCPVCLGTSC
jgi:hypothetical protein